MPAFASDGGRRRAGPGRVGTVRTTVLGYPHLGRRGELCAAIESYLEGCMDAAVLERTAAALRADVWTELAGAGLDSVPSNMFTYHDHVLDTAVLFGAVPRRYRAVGTLRAAGRSPALDVYFTMARGAGGLPPLATARWFGSSLRTVVPELDEGTRFRLAEDVPKPLREFFEARRLGLFTRPVLLGPLTFLLLARPSPAASPDFTPLDLLDDLVAAYVELLTRLGRAGVEGVQLDEPALTAGPGTADLAGLRRAYRRLVDTPGRPRILLSTFFGELGPALPVIADVGVEAVGLDFVAGPGNLATLAGVGGLGSTTVVAGVVDGYTTQATDLPSALSTCAVLLGLAGDVVVSTSCSLVHLPPEADPRVVDLTAPARRRVDEVMRLGRAFHEDRPAPAP
ncbi:hypothetical protein [Frankia sp. AvcI1]|uniref:hypothetical protein n=1 Tax=Frankia sp. AvcI1 TaxID=573496 RepID=UPI002118F875|nr:hypothetical protein [Frankia sp. AvcI1]